MYLCFHPQCHFVFERLRVGKIGELRVVSPLHVHSSRLQNIPAQPECGGPLYTSGYYLRVNAASLSRREPIARHRTHAPSPEAVDEDSGILDSAQAKRITSTSLSLPPQVSYSAPAAHPGSGPAIRQPQRPALSSEEPRQTRARHTPRDDE